MLASALAPKNDSRRLHMAFLLTLFFALIAGLLAQVMTPGLRPIGLLMTLVVGLVGWMLSSVVGEETGFYDANETAGWFGALLGALLILTLYRVAFQRSTKRTSSGEDVARIEYEAGNGAASSPRARTLKGAAAR